MGTVEERKHLRCRLCFARLTDRGVPVQITDMKGRAFAQNATINKIKSFLHIKVDFPDNFNCVLPFPHFACGSCNDQMHIFSQFIERAQVIDTELRFYDFSKDKRLSEIETSLKENYLSLYGNRKQNSPTNYSATENKIITFNERNKKVKEALYKNTHGQNSKPIEPNRGKLRKNICKRPVAILPKTSSSHTGISANVSAIHFGTGIAENMNVSFLHNHDRRQSMPFPDTESDKEKIHFTSSRHCSKCGVAIQATKLKDVWQHICETQSKLFQCDVPECKRTFETITALRHHLKHFHRSYSKPDKTDSCATKNQQVIIQSHNPSLAVETTINPQLMNYVTDMRITSGLPTSSLSDQFQRSIDGSKSTKCDTSMLVVNLKKPFICSHTGCLKAYKNKHYLIDHERVHAGEKPYLCKNCCRKFYRVTDLKKHILLKVCQ